MIALHRAASHPNFVDAFACFADWTIKNPGKVVAHVKNAFDGQNYTISVSTRQSSKDQTYSASELKRENLSRPASQTSRKPTSSCLLYIHLAARNMAIDLMVRPACSIITRKASIRVTFPRLDCGLCVAGSAVRLAATVVCHTRIFTESERKCAHIGNLQMKCVPNSRNDGINLHELSKGSLDLTLAFHICLTLQHATHALRQMYFRNMQVPSPSRKAVNKMTYF